MERILILTLPINLKTAPIYIISTWLSNFFLNNLKFVSYFIENQSFHLLFIIFFTAKSRFSPDKKSSQISFLIRLKIQNPIFICIYYFTYMFLFFTNQITKTIYFTIIMYFIYQKFINFTHIGDIMFLQQIQKK